MVAKPSRIGEIVTSLKKKPLGIGVLAILNLMASIFYFLLISMISASPHNLYLHIRVGTDHDVGFLFSAHPNSHP